MIRRLGRYVLAAYPPRIYLPLMIFWAVGLTALFACITGDVHHWRLDGGLAITAITLVVDMLAMRALDDIGDYRYDLDHNPRRPLPSGMVGRRDLVTLIVVSDVALLAINAPRGLIPVMLAVQLIYATGVVILDMATGWPPGDRPMLNLAVSLPGQPLLSLYVYAGFLHQEHQRPSLTGLLVIVAVTLGGLCLEFGRKAVRTPKPGERTYVTVLGATGTSVAALAFAATAAVIVAATLRPWDPNSAGFGWGWLVLIPPAIPAVAAARFANGTQRWPVRLSLAYLPAMYASFLAVGWLTKGTLR